MEGENLYYVFPVARGLQKIFFSFAIAGVNGRIGNMR